MPTVVLLFQYQAWQACELPRAIGNRNLGSKPRRPCPAPKSADRLLATVAQNRTNLVRKRPFHKHIRRLLILEHRPVFVCPMRDHHFVVPSVFIDLHKKPSISTSWNILAFPRPLRANGIVAKQGITIRLRPPLPDVKAKHIMFFFSEFRRIKHILHLVRNRILSHVQKREFVCPHEPLRRQRKHCQKQDYNKQYSFHLHSNSTGL